MERLWEDKTDMRQREMRNTTAFCGFHKVWSDMDVVVVGGGGPNSTNSQAKSTHACFGGYVWFACFTILLRNIAVEDLQQK